MTIYYGETTMSNQPKLEQGGTEPRVVTAQAAILVTGLFIVVLLIGMKIVVRNLPFERVDLPHVTVEDVNAPLVLNEQTRMRTYVLHNQFANQVDESFATAMCDASASDLEDVKAKLEKALHSLPEDDLDRLEYEFHIGFVNVELVKRYKVLRAQYE
jgi:hypothetical protein